MVEEKPFPCSFCLLEEGFPQNTPLLHLFYPTKGVQMDLGHLGKTRLCSAQLSGDENLLNFRES